MHQLVPCTVCQYEKDVKVWWEEEEGEGECERECDLQ